MVRCTTIHEAAINSIISQTTCFSGFLILYGQEVSLPFDYTLTNPSLGILQPTTTSLLKNTMQNAFAQL